MPNTTSLATIGQRIKDARWEHNWTMKRLADNAGISDITLIGRIEAGSTKVPDSTLERLAKALDTTLEYLKTGIKPPIQATQNELENFENMMQNLPIKPGDTIWYKADTTGVITPFVIKNCICKVDCEGQTGGRGEGIRLTFDLNTLGKNLFLSEESAKNAPTNE